MAVVDQQKNSQFYDPKPMFSGAPTVSRPSRLEGNRVQLVIAIIVMVAAIASGLIYFLNRDTQSGTQVSPGPRVQTR